jgi:asparagine synthase (glutamine-hydrolysing)
VHAYEEWGKSCVERFKGMFAFALWDSKNRTLFLARDRLGIKPLFFAVLGGVFYFASEMKAILHHASFPREMDFDGVASYFTLGYIPAPLTIFKHIRKLLPGHTIEIVNGGLSIRQYWDLHFDPDRSRPERYYVDRFMGLLEDAVKLRLISDVPLGAFLSGGIDSGTVVALMSRLSNGAIRSFNIGFGGDVGGYLDERSYARQVASKYGCIHTEHEVWPNVDEIIQDIVRAFDEPFADHSSVPSYYVSKVTRQYVTVALSGLGGDELFGGYERYVGFKLGDFYNRVPHFLREKVIRRLIEKIPERSDGHYTINHLKRFVRGVSLPQGERYFDFVGILRKDRRASLFSEPELLGEHLDRCEEMFMSYFNSANARDPLDRVFYTDIKTYLPEDILACTDRMSMWHSLEVRVPFLDHKLVEFCATIPSEMKIRNFERKHLLKKGVSSLLPQTVLSHRKQGFVGPMTQWLRTDLRSYVLEVLSDVNLDKHKLLNKNLVKQLISEHLEKTEIHDKLIWSLVIFQTWFNMYVEGNA